MSRPSNLDSGFYSGRVRHTRREPVLHRFSYAHFLVGLELDSIDRLFAGRWLWSRERANWASFRRRDHLGDPKRALEDCVRELILERCGLRTRGKILLLTQLRHFGYVFNPVSFYLCFDEAGGIEVIVAEINNTPWGEQHCYVLPAREAQHTGEGGLRFQFGKAFHISPFFPMQLRYDWSFTPGDRELAITMHNLSFGRGVFTSEIVLRSRPWSARNAAWALAAHPWMSFKTIAAIYWQALRLRLKGAAFFPHPGPRAEAIAAPSANSRQVSS